MDGWMTVPSGVSVWSGVKMGGSRRVGRKGDHERMQWLRGGAQARSVPVPSHLVCGD